MQSPLFAHNDVQTQDRWSLQNQRMLRITLEGHDDVLARKGTMVAYQGLIEFDAEYQSTDQAYARARSAPGYCERSASRRCPVAATANRHA